MARKKALTWESLQQRWEELCENKTTEGSPEMAAFNRDLMTLTIATPADDVPEYWRAVPPAPKTTSGEYLARALSTLGGAIGGAWLGGKRRG